MPRARRVGHVRLPPRERRSRGGKPSKKTPSGGLPGRLLGEQGWKWRVPCRCATPPHNVNVELVARCAACAGPNAQSWRPEMKRVRADAK